MTLLTIGVHKRQLDSSIEELNEPSALNAEGFFVSGEGLQAGHYL